MIITILNFETSDVAIIKCSDYLDEQYKNVEELIEKLGYNINNICYMVSTDLTTDVYESSDKLELKNIARFIL